jgi:hypothetical protein
MSMRRDHTAGLISEGALRSYGYVVRSVGDKADNLIRLFGNKMNAGGFPGDAVLISRACNLLSGKSSFIDLVIRAASPGAVGLISSISKLAITADYLNFVAVL